MNRELESIKKGEAEKQTFKEHYPEGELTEVKVDQIPEAALVHFDNRITRYVKPEEYDPSNADRLLLVEHAEGDKTYVMQYEVVMENTSETEKQVSLCDVDSEGEQTGYLDLVNVVSSEEPFFKDKPFVAFTRTTGAKAKGYGTRRYLVANAVSQTLFDKPLCSDTMLGAEDSVQRGLWRKFVDEGKAERFIEQGGKERFKFKE